MRATIALALLVLAGTAATIALGAAGEGGSRPEAHVTATSGSFDLANSRDGMPVFTATNIAPGDSAAGMVEIANEGDEAIEVTLSQRDLLDAPGPGGGVLSQRLALRIDALSSPTPAYLGPLATMPPLALGRLEPGDSRAFEFVATLPEDGAPGAAENAVQGASTSVAYNWTARSAPPEAPARTTPIPGGPGPTPSGSSPQPSTPPLGVGVLDYRHTLRNGRIVAWARCNQACRIRSHVSFLAPKLSGELPATARHAQRRRFGARTRRLAVRLPRPELRLLSGGAATARIVIVARGRDGESTRTSALLHLRRTR